MSKFTNMKHEWVHLRDKSNEPRLCLKLWFGDEANRETCSLNHRNIVLLFCYGMKYPNKTHQNLLILKNQNKNINKTNNLMKNTMEK